MANEIEVIITQDQHYQAFQWLEDHLESKCFLFDLEDWKAMEQQVVAGVLIRQSKETQ